MISHPSPKGQNDFIERTSLPPHEIYLILSYLLKKSREFLYTRPEISLNKAQKAKFESLVKRRLNHEPMAYILGRKEFYGLDFRVNKNTLIPRPETEMLAELAIWNIEHKAWNKKDKLVIVDVGTGSGNIIISLAHNIKHGAWSMEYGTWNKIKLFATDISSEALRVAKFNAKKNNVNKKIKFLKGNLLEPIIKNKKCSMLYVPCSMIIVANLPYLSKKIYSSSMPDVKNYEPKNALLSGTDGLDHYDELLKQIKKIKEACSMFPASPAGGHVLCYMEISPEQKNKLGKLIKKYFPKSKVEFKKDLAGKWRAASVEI